MSKTIHYFKLWPRSKCTSISDFRPKKQAIQFKVKRDFSLCTFPPILIAMQRQLDNWTKPIIEPIVEFADAMGNLDLGRKYLCCISSVLLLSKVTFWWKNKRHLKIANQEDDMARWTYWKSSYPGQRGLSLRSVERFYSAKAICKQPKVTGKEPNAAVSDIVSKVSYTKYGDAPKHVYASWPAQ